MLFYARKSLLAECRGRPPPLPAWAQAQIAEANAKLEATRQAEEREAHRCGVVVVPAAHVRMLHGCLVPRDSMAAGGGDPAAAAATTAGPWAAAGVALTLDQRDPLASLWAALPPSWATTATPRRLHRLRPAGSGHVLHGCHPHEAIGGIAADPPAAADPAAVATTTADPPAAATADPATAELLCLVRCSPSRRIEPLL